MTFIFYSSIVYLCQGDPFIQKCDVINFEYDDTLSEITNTKESYIEYLIHDDEVAINVCHNNFMETNPSYLQFILMKYNLLPVRRVSLTVINNVCMYVNNTRTKYESQVKLPEIILDEKLKFSNEFYIRMQINRFISSIDLDTSLILRKADIQYTFIWSNINHCPIV